MIKDIIIYYAMFNQESSIDGRYGKKPVLNRQFITLTANSKACRANHLTPAPGLVRDEGSGFLWRAADRFAGLLTQTLQNCRLVHRGDDIGSYSRNQCRRRSGRCHERIPRSRIDAVDPNLGGGWDARQLVRTVLRADCKDADRAREMVGQRGSDVVEEDVDMAADEVVEGRRGAAVGDWLKRTPARCSNIAAVRCEVDPSPWLADVEAARFAFAARRIHLARVCRGIDTPPRFGALARMLTARILDGSKGRLA